MVHNAVVSVNRLMRRQKLILLAQCLKKAGNADDSVLARFMDHPSFSNERLRDAVALMYTSQYRVVPPVKHDD